MRWEKNVVILLLLSVSMNGDVVFEKNFKIFDLIQHIENFIQLKIFIKNECNKKKYTKIYSE